MAKESTGRRFIWARNRNANGHGNDPMPQIIYQDVGVSHLEIVSSVTITHVDQRLTIDWLAAMYPAPEVEAP